MELRRQKALSYMLKALFVSGPLMPGLSKPGPDVPLFISSQRLW